MNIFSIFIVILIVVLPIGGIIVLWVISIGSPKKNYNKRTRAIEEEVTSIGGIVEKIETSKSSCYPYYNEINLDDGSYHVYYKVTYRLNDEIKEGWVVLKLQQSIYGPNGATTNEWIWKL